MVTRKYFFKRSSNDILEEQNRLLKEILSKQEAKGQDDTPRVPSLEAIPIFNEDIPLAGDYTCSFD